MAELIRLQFGSGGILTMLHPSHLIAQCVMCFRTAAAQQAGRSHVLNLGILILLLAPLAVLCALIVLVRKREASRKARQ